MSDGFIPGDVPGPNPFIDSTKGFRLPAVTKAEINDMVETINRSNQHWWTDPVTGESIDVDAKVPEKLCLIHSEISEAMEGHRKGLQDDKLPHRPMVEVELADAVIRIFDLAGQMGLDLGGAIVEKHAYNQTRADHSREARLAAGGKKY